jgi:hypothetical protein
MALDKTVLTLTWWDGAGTQDFLRIVYTGLGNIVSKMAVDIIVTQTNVVGRRLYSSFSARC